MKNDSNLAFVWMSPHMVIKASRPKDRLIIRSPTSGYKCFHLTETMVAPITVTQEQL